MASTMFMRVDEVAEELGVSVPYAYKLIRSMNAELKKPANENQALNRRKSKEIFKNQKVYTK